MRRKYHITYHILVNSTVYIQYIQYIYIVVYGAVWWQYWRDRNILLTTCVCKEYIVWLSMCNVYFTGECLQCDVSKHLYQYLLCCWNVLIEDPLCFRIWSIYFSHLIVRSDYGLMHDWNDTSEELLAFVHLQWLCQYMCGCCMSLFCASILCWTRFKEFTQKCIGVNVCFRDMTCTYQYVSTVNRSIFIYSLVVLDVWEFAWMYLHFSLIYIEW